MTSLTPTALPIDGHSDYDRRNDIAEMAADDFHRDPETPLSKHVEFRTMAVFGGLRERSLRQWCRICEGLTERAKDIIAHRGPPLEDEDEEGA